MKISISPGTSMSPLYASSQTARGLADPLIACMRPLPPNRASESSEITRSKQAKNRATNGLEVQSRRGVTRPWCRPNAQAWLLSRGAQISLLAVLWQVGETGRDIDRERRFDCCGLPGQTTDRGHAQNRAHGGDPTFVPRGTSGQVISRWPRKIRGRAQLDARTLDTNSSKDSQ